MADLEKVATLISFLLVAGTLSGIAQDEIQRKGDLMHLYSSVTIVPGLTFSGISVAVFFSIRYLLTYALIWIPFFTVIGGVIYLMEK